MGYEPDVGMELVGNSGWTSRVQPKGVAEEQTGIEAEIPKSLKLRLLLPHRWSFTIVWLKNEFRLKGII